MMGAMTVVLSMTTVNVAFPDIMGAFGIGRDKAQLLSSGVLGGNDGGNGFGRLVHLYLW